MILFTEAGIFNTSNGFMALKEPAECRCGRMAYFVKNEGGTTKCLECAEKESLSSSNATNGGGQ